MVSKREHYHKNRALASGSAITNRSSISANRIQIEELLNPLGLSFGNGDDDEDINEENKATDGFKPTLGSKKKLPD